MEETESSLQGSWAECRARFAAFVREAFDEATALEVERALDYADYAHKGQTRDDHTPYILHPLRTAWSLLQEFHICRADLACASLLHDVLEDQRHEHREGIQEAFGNHVANIVSTLTKPARGKLSRYEINQPYFERLSRSDAECKLIKILDKLDNVRDALNCPDPEKQERTLAEAREFYVPLVRSLPESPYKGRLLARLIAACQGLAKHLPGTTS